MSDLAISYPDIYDRIFIDEEAKKNLPSSKEELSIGPNEPDISITAHNEPLFVTIDRKMDRYVAYKLQRMIMFLLYPAQSHIARYLGHSYFPVTSHRIDTDYLDYIRRKKAKRLQDQGFIVKHVQLKRNNTSYSGVLIGRAETITNGKWALYALGRSGCAEHQMDFLSTHLTDSSQSNLLIMNGPGVGRSEGEAVPFTMAEAQDTGLLFLEHALKAQKIAIFGYSLGGAAIGQAILQHEFLKDRRYLVIRCMTFDRTSHICAKFFEIPFLKTIKKIGLYSPKIYSQIQAAIQFLICFTGCEMDSVAASKKLQELKIHEIVIQKGNQVKQTVEYDGVIPVKASLAHALIEENLLEHKTIVLTPHKHGDYNSLFSINPLAARFFNE